MQVLSLLFGNKIRFFATTLILVLVASIGYFGYRYITNLQELVINQSASIARQEIVLESAQESIIQLQSDMEQGAALRAELARRIDEANIQVSDLRQILRDHNLTQLAEERPGLIETRINRATQEVFDSIESLTSN